MKKALCLLLLSLLMNSCQGGKSEVNASSSSASGSSISPVEFENYEVPVDKNDYYWNNFLFSAKSETTCSVCINPSYAGGKMEIPSYSPSGLRVVELEPYLNLNIDGAPDYERQSPVKAVVLPETLEQMDSSCLGFASSVRTLRIPDGVKEIEAGAFGGLYSLDILYLPAAMTSIGNICSSYTYLPKLSTVFLPKQAKVLGEEAFKDCSRLQTVPLPYGLKTVGASAFEGCVSLREVRIPKSVDLVGDSAYRGCSSLSVLTLEDGVAALGAGAFRKTALRKVFLPKSLASVGAGCFGGCPEDLVIYCEAETRPEGWDAHFDDPRDSHKVVWGAKREDAN